MYEPPDIKPDSANLDPLTLCPACLSSDRALSVVGDYIEVYHQIVDSSRTYAAAQNTYLCWECVAILKKVHNFKVRAENAHRLLMYQLSNSDSSSLPTLSTLTTIFKVDAFFFAHDDDESRLKQEIVKSESDDNQINYDSEQEIQIEYRYDETQDIETKDTEKKDIEKKDIETKDIEKKDIQPVKIQFQKRLKYRYVYNENVRKKSLLREMIEIKPSDVEEWIEKERNTDYYKKLRYKCKHCWFGSNKLSKYNNHKAAVHNKAKGPFECPICKYRFGTESDLNTHTLSHHVGRQCGTCGLQCYSARHFNAHLETHRMIQCKTCRALFSELKLFREHHKSIHSMYICDSCGKKTKSKAFMEQHMKHHATRHPCTMCKKVFSTYSRLYKHTQQTHNAPKGELAYCVICDKQFCNIYVYRMHIKKCHMPEKPVLPPERVPCPSCENTYSQKNAMLNHYKRIHLNSEEHYCAECNKCFTNKFQLREHKMYIHEGIPRPKTKICKLCGRGFNTNKTLNNHILTHTGERPHECEECGAKFTQKNSLVLHKKKVHAKTK